MRHAGHALRLLHELIQIKRGRARGERRGRGGLLRGLRLRGGGVTAVLGEDVLKRIVLVRGSRLRAGGATGTRGLGSAARAGRLRRETRRDIGRRAASTGAFVGGGRLCRRFRGGLLRGGGFRLRLLRFRVLQRLEIHERAGQVKHRWMDSSGSGGVSTPSSTSASRRSLAARRDFGLLSGRVRISLSSPSRMFAMWPTLCCI